MPRTSDAVGESCSFCVIADGYDSSVDIIAESGLWLAFFPKEQATLGHTLVIPRRHATNFWTLDEQLAAELGRAAWSLGNAIMRALDPEGMNLITSAGDAAEQTVFHVHLHLVPRWHDDGLAQIWAYRGRIRAAQRSDTAKRIRAAYEKS